MTRDQPRPGDRALPFDPAETAADAGLQFIGRIRSSWPDSGSCPKNLREARETGTPARVEVDPPYREGLDGLGAFSHAILLYWMDRARRDLIVQRPRGADRPMATFSIRSPVRPNPVGLAVVKLLSCDAATGVLEIDAIDCIDGTPLIDIKPYFPSVDAVPGAATGGETDVDG